MSVTIQIKRGTEAEIQSATLASGELAFATDSKNVFCSDGSGKHLVGSLLIDSLANRPASGVAGRLFLDSSTGVLYMDTGAEWINHTHTESDISDLGSYAASDHNHDSTYASTTHASGHLSGASDEIDADKLDIDFSPSNYTAATVSNITDSTAQLTSHLKGIDTKLASSGITAGKSIALSIVFGG